MTLSMCTNLSLSGVRGAHFSHIEFKRDLIVVPLIVLNICTTHRMSKSSTTWWWQRQHIFDIWKSAEGCQHHHSKVFVCAGLLIMLVLVLMLVLSWCVLKVLAPLLCSQCYSLHSMLNLSHQISTQRRYPIVTELVGIGLSNKAFFPFHQASTWPAPKRE